MTDQDLLMMLDAPYQWTFQVPWGAALGTAGSLRNALQAALSRPDVAGISRVPRRMRLIDPKSADEHVTLSREQMVQLMALIPAGTRK